MSSTFRMGGSAVPNSKSIRATPQLESFFFWSAAAMLPLMSALIAEDVRTEDAGATVVS